MDELEFARETLRRAVLNWANEIVPQAEKIPGEGLADVLLIISFPSKEYRDYHDLVHARVETLRAEMGEK